MTPFFWLDVVALAVMGQVTIALALIAVGFGPRRAVNITFALFMLAMTAWAWISLALRILLWIERANVQLIHELAIASYGLAGLFLLLFTARYLDRRVRWIDALLLGGGLALAVLAVPLFQGRLVTNVRLDSSGMVASDIGMAAVLTAALLPGVYIAIALVLFWRHRRTGLAVSMLVLLAGYILWIVSVPLPLFSLCTMAGTLIIGYEVIHRQLFNPLRERTVALLREVAQRKRVEATLIQRTEQLATLNAIGRAVSTLQDVDSMLAMLLEQVQGVVPLDTFCVCLYDATTSLVSFPLVYDDGQRWDEPAEVLNEATWVGQMIRSAQPWMLNRTSEEIARDQHGHWRLGDRSRPSASVLVAPLQVGARVVGVLSAQSYALNAYTQDHLALLTGVAQQVAAALDNARLFEALRQELAERTRTEHEREQLIAELEAKNAELERFAYTVSHDLKNPLVTIGSFLGYLEQDALSGNIVRLQSDINRIRHAVETMRRLLNDLLWLSRIGRATGPPQATPFGEIVQEALDVLHGRLAAAQASVSVAADLPVVYGDRVRLVEVVQNLVDNAAKFMGDQPAPCITIGVRTQHAEQVFYVQDNGIGIDPRFQQKAFGLFERLDHRSEGSGIGLAIVKRIIELHGGRIWIESDGRGNGSTFCFTLPMKPA